MTEFRQLWKKKRKQTVKNDLIRSMLKLYVILIAHFRQAIEAYQRYKPYINNFFR